MGQATRIAVTFFMAGLACLAVPATGISYMAVKQDEQARANQILMVGGGFAQLAETLKSLNSDYAFWDDLYVRVPSTDDEWFSTNVATAVTANGTVDFLAVLDKDKKPFRGWHVDHGEKSDAAFVTPEFIGQVETLLKDNPKGKFPPRSAVVELGDDHYLLSVTHIYPTTEEQLTDRERQPYLVLGYKLVGERIDQLGATYLLSNLTYSKNPTEGLAVALGVDGKPIGSFNWTPETPGTTTLRNALLPIGAAAVLILGLGAAFAWRGRQIAAAMARREEETRKAAETAMHALARKGKLEQLGQLTATVAHEIRNPLGSIRTSLFLIERRLGGQKLGLESQLERIRTGVVRCDDIITQLLDYSRNNPVQAKPEDLDSWLEKLLNEEVQKLPSTVLVKMELGLGGEQVAFDGARLSRAITNLVFNASEAMVDDNIKKPGPAERSPTIWIKTFKSSRGFEISVEDNGPGIEPRNLEKILDPLFTTKSFGTGLGLPAVENIMRQHNGGLEIHSEVGKGARFTAWLPAVENQSAIAA